MPISFTNTIISRKAQIGSDKRLEKSDLPKGQPAHVDIEPIIKTLVKHKGDTDPIESAELEEYPD